MVEFEKVYLKALEHPGAANRHFTQRARQWAAQEAKKLRDCLPYLTEGHAVTAALRDDLARIEQALRNHPAQEGV